MKTVIFKLINALLLFGLMGWGCEKENEYEDIPLEYMKCPCEHETDFIKKEAFKDILLFDASKTTYSDAKELSFNGEKSRFVYYNQNSDTTIYYTIQGGMAGVGYICNFPDIAEEWDIPSSGIKISGTADEFEVCEPPISLNSTYSNLVLSTLKKQKNGKG